MLIQLEGTTCTWLQDVKTFLVQCCFLIVFIVQITHAVNSPSCLLQVKYTDIASIVYILRMCGRTLLYMTVCSCTRYNMRLHVAQDVHEIHAYILYACEKLPRQPCYPA